MVLLDLKVFEINELQSVNQVVMRRYFEYHIEYLELRASYTRIYFELKGRYKIQRVKMKKRAKRDYFQKTLEQKWAIFFDMCKRLLSLPLLINIKRFLWSFFCKHNLSLAGIRHLLLTIMPHRCPLMAIIILTLQWVRWKNARWCLKGEKSEELCGKQQRAIL